VKWVATVVAALIAWFFVATVGNLLIRMALPDYAAQEAAMAFSIPAEWARLLLGVVATAAASWVALQLSGGRRALAVATGVVLLVMFVPVHIGLWDQFPLWYHLFFLASLPLVALAMARLMPSTQAPATA